VRPRAAAARRAALAHPANDARATPSAAVLGLTASLGAVAVRPRAERRVGDGGGEGACGGGGAERLHASMNSL